jgi:hypothetical protein
MKKLLLLLLISTIAYAIVEESNEYEDVSLEFNFKPLINVANKAKGSISKAVKPLAKPIVKAVDKGGKVVNKISRPIVKPLQKMVNNGQKVVQKKSN